MESGGSDDGIHYSVAAFYDDLHGDGDRRHDDLHQQRQWHRDGQPAANGECELGHDLRGRFSNPDRDDERDRSQLLVESGRGDDGVNHGIAGFNDDLHGDSD
jgi:hypothetical protein